MVRLTSLLLVTLLHGACSPAAPHAAAALALGSGAPDGELAPFSDGQDVTLVAGAQGGFHVWMAYRLRGAPVGTAELERTAHRLTDDALVLRTRGELELPAGDDPGVPTVPMFMCPSPIGLSVVDQPIVFQLRFSDAEGEIARGAVTLVPHCPDEQADFCRRICTG